MYVSSISPLPKTKPKFPFRYIVALSKDSLLTSLTNSKVIWNVGIFLEKTRETKSKQVKQTGQLAGLNEHDAVVCSLLLRRRRGRRKRKKSGEEQCKIRCHISWKGLTIESSTPYDWRMSRSRQEKTFQEKLKSIFKWVPPQILTS